VAAQGLCAIPGWLRAAALGALLLRPETLAAQTGSQAALPSPAPKMIHRAAGAITADGDLGDPGWQGALTFDEFWEMSPADNIPAKVKTTVWLTYDERYFYIAVKADDPEPAKIRAPYVDRDAVIGTDDNIAVFLDTRGDRHAALELRVSPRGIQGDASYNDANGVEDFAPDFFYDTGAQITASGWQAELRIPFSSLRYPKTDPQAWNILVWRNWPRDYRYFFMSAPIPRDSNCWICRAPEIQGLSGLPDSKHLVVAPYATAELAGAREAGLDSPFRYGDVDYDGGVDVKWNPTAASAVDVTVNPDFSQIESDTAQISSNQRFALFFPEKRPFFLEGVDLFDLPIQAVYTRNLTDPRWGVRATGKTGDTAYTMLISEDSGGGLVVLPGPEGSDLAPQDFASTVAIGRLRHELGRSFAGFLVTDREIDGGGHNRVAGPDLHWRPNDGDRVDLQLLWSDSATPRRPDLASEWTGQSLSGHAFRVDWNHLRTNHDIGLHLGDFSDDFRADLGFVPQVGYRDAFMEAGLRFYPQGLFRFSRYYLTAQAQEDQHGESLGHNFSAGFFGTGSKNLQANAELNHHQVRAAGELVTQDYLRYVVQVDPGRRFPRITLDGIAGRVADFANGGLGDGLQIGVSTNLRPTDHLDLLLTLRRDSLDVDRHGRSGRLYTETIERLKVTYTLSQRCLLRLIGQYVETTRDPGLYSFPVEEQSGQLQGSALFSYKLNWQTVLFLGYGDDRTLDARSELTRTGNALFLKISYALQR